MLNTSHPVLIPCLTAYPGCFDLGVRSNQYMVGLADSGICILPSSDVPLVVALIAYSSLSKCANLVSTTCLLVSSISPARNTSSRIA